MTIGELLRPSLLRSRFGRRLVLLFAVCSLIPTLAFAVLSYRTVSRQLRQASLARLEQSARLLEGRIMDRLEGLEHDLRLVRPHPFGCPALPAPADLACDGSLRYGLSALAFVRAGAAPVTLFGRFDEPPVPDSAEAERLERRERVVADRVVGGRSEVHLLVPAAEGSGILIGRLDPEYFWGHADQVPLVATMEFHVVNAAGRVIAASRSGAEPLGASQLSDLPRARSGTLEWTLGDDRYLAAYAPMSTLPVPGEAGWILVVSEAWSAVVAPMSDFARSFPVVIVLALGAAIALSLSQLRRSLAPLQALHEGTRRLARREFDRPVTVRSQDEFAEVAASFNAMADQIRRQFASLATAAEIERAVLSSVDTDHIVRTVLGRLPEVCACDAVAVSLFHPATGDEVTSFRTGGGPAGPVESWTGRLDPVYRERLAASVNGLRLQAAAAPPYLAPLVGGSTRTLLVFPLHHQTELHGTITLAGDDALGEEQEPLIAARRMAGQVAAALSNARQVEQIQQLAFYDGLTGLPNRVSFKRRLKAELEQAGRDGSAFALCFLDLDHFSRINDTLGHRIGDRLVQEVGHRVRDCCERTVTGASVSRLGGDEFTVILPELGDRARVIDLARRLLEAFDTPFSLDGHEVFVSTSIGVAMHPADGTDVESLLKNADVAMYAAKKKGRNRVELYADSMSTTAARRLTLEHQLRKAMEDGDFVMWYQPIADLATGRIASAEALIRWEHAEWGTVAPGEFIAVCEESGLIVPVGDWVLRTVCEQHLAWQRQGLRAIPIALNLSGKQLRNDATVDTVRGVLETTGLDPRYLVLELTESVLMHGEGASAAALQALAALGVGLAVDDFGTGYSSLSYLKHFPVQSLKIDQSFIREVTTSPDDAAITTAIIAMGSALGLRIVAEGVEREDQVAFLRRQGCDRVQGYLIGRPVPAHAFEAYLQGDGQIPALRPPAERPTRRRRAG